MAANSYFILTKVKRIWELCPQTLRKEASATSAQGNVLTH